MANRIIRETRLSTLTLRGRGKVRDIYDLGDALLIVATDRISAFDVVMPTPIPDKGRVLTQISCYWFEVVGAEVPHHLLTADVDAFPAPCRPYADLLRGRSMVVKKAKPLPIECIVRGYLSGSGWKDYQRSGAVCGIPLPAGLTESAELPEPLFTPSTKAEAGAHDQNIDFAAAARLVGEPLAAEVRRLSLAIYRRSAALARERGIIIADTKLEFGLDGGRLLLIDEVLTPDSSRFWPADQYAAGRAQPSYDKQYLRDYLERSGWPRRPPAPELPAEVVAQTRARYLEALERLTGRGLV